jgi:hypothetical protein
MKFSQMLASVETSQVLFLERSAQPAANVWLLVQEDAPIDDARILQPLALAQFAAATTSTLLFIHKMVTAACVTAGVCGKADWLVGISTDSHFILQLDTQEDSAAVQLIGFLRDRVVFACGNWLGSVSKLDDEEPLSSLDYQPHSSAITHLLTGLT